LELLLTAAHLFDLPIWHWERRLLVGDAVPEIFHKLQTLCPAKLKEMCKFGVH
jgi:hypothetical protein